VLYPLSYGGLFDLISVGYNKRCINSMFFWRNNGGRLQTIIVDSFNYVRSEILSRFVCLINDLEKSTQDSRGIKTQQTVPPNE
jgi:hypothetical protein